MSPPNTPPKWILIGGVGLAVLAISFAAILIRLAEAPAVAVAFWRNLFGTAFLLPFALLKREHFPRGRYGWGAIIAGIALAAHFGLWITSLDLTSVASSVVLVCTQPIFVALFAWLFLKEKISRVATIGIFIAVAGTFIIGSDYQFGQQAMLGNILALGGAVAIAIYVLLGRWIRTEGTSILAYSVVVYGSASVALATVCLGTGTQMFGYSTQTWICLVLMTLGPQIMGHTVFNWALKYIKAPVLSGTILLEPVLSTLLAWVILREEPLLSSIFGGVVILVGLALVIRGR